MKRVFLALLILILLLIDWLTFHDFMKGERYTFTQFLTGLVSLPLFFLLGKDLLENKL